MSHDKPRPATPRRDERPPRAGWAPGEYQNRCYRCGVEFIGDKRAIHCADCAYVSPSTGAVPSTPGSRACAISDGAVLRLTLTLTRRRIDQFQSEMETFMSELHDAFAALETGLSALEADEAQAETTIAADDAQIVDLRTQITDLQAQLAEAQAGASDLTPAEVNAAAKRLATMETRLHALLNPAPPPIEVVTPEAPPSVPSDGTAPGVGITSARPDDQPLGEPASTEQTPVGQG